jgi:hypothetical protein
VAAAEVTAAPAGTPAAGRRALLALWAGGTAAIALTGLVLWWTGTPGWDLAAHLYKTWLLREGYAVFWDNHWYGGSYGAITYGVVYYLLAVVIPWPVLVVLSAGALPPLFFLYYRAAWGVEEIWPAVILAGVMCMYLSHGQDPFLLALALTLGAMALTVRGHPLWGAVLAGVGVFTNPLALIVGGVFLVADLAARPALRRPLLLFAAGLAPFVLARLLVGLVFAEPGWYLDQLLQAVLYASFAVVGVTLALVSEAYPRRPFVLLFVVYGAVVLGTTIVPGSPLGSNVGRFFMVFAFSVLFFLRRDRFRRPLGSRWLPWALLPVLGFACLQMSTPVSHYFTAREELPATTREFWAPALAAAERYDDPDHRLHVVAPRRHFEAWYLPEAGHPITRGWYRQADALHNRVFYTAYGPQQYVTWLRSMGVEYILLPDDPLDPWSRREPGILARAPEFELVEETGAWMVYRLRDAEGLVRPLDGGAGRVVEHDHLGLRVEVDRPGRYLVKVTSTPFWRLEGVRGSLAATRDHFVLLRAEEAGVATLRFDLDWGVAARQLF